MSSPNPNILFLMLDSVRKDAVTERTMPRLMDRFNHNWVSYESAFASAPWTLPSHASIFTGKLPREHTATAHSKFLPNEFRTLAEDFSERDYHTRLISNNMYLSSTFGMDRGFDQVLMELETKIYPDETGMFLRERLKKSDSPLEALSDFISEGGPKALVNLVYKYLQLLSDHIGPADTGASKMIEYFLKQPSTTSEFTFFNFMEAHLPYEPPEPFKSDFCPPGYTVKELKEINQNQWDYLLGKSDTDFQGLEALYHASVAYLDEKLDFLLDELSRQDRLKDTIVVLCGDHGDHFGEHGMQGHVGSLYKELTHVPLYIRFPQARDGGEIVNDTVSLRQLYASLVDWSGGDSSLTEGISSSLPTPTHSGESGPAIAEYMGVQDLNVPEEGMSKYDRRLTALYDAQGYIVTSDTGIVHEEGNSDESLIDSLLEDVPDNIDNTGNRDIPDDVKDRLKAVGYVQ